MVLSKGRKYAQNNLTIIKIKYVSCNKYFCYNYFFEEHKFVNEYLQIRKYIFVYICCYINIFQIF